MTTIAPIQSPNRTNEIKTSKFDRRCLLPLRRDCLWLLQTGVVRTVTMLEDGTQVTLGLWGPGDVVGRVLSKADPYEIECLTPVSASLLPAVSWHEATEAMILHMSAIARDD